MRPIRLWSSPLRREDEPWRSTLFLGGQFPNFEINLNFEKSAPNLNFQIYLLFNFNLLLSFDDGDLHLFRADLLTDFSGLKFIGQLGLSFLKINKSFIDRDQTKMRVFNFFLKRAHQLGARKCQLKTRIITQKSSHDWRSHICNTTTTHFFFFFKINYAIITAVLISRSKLDFCSL